MSVVSMIGRATALAALLQCTALCYAAAVTNAPKQVDYRLWGDVLKRFRASDGQVKYAALKAAPQQLNQFLDQIAAIPSARLSRLGKAEQIAFWLNAYNALILKAIIDHYPIDRRAYRYLVYPRMSIRQVDGVFDALKYKVARKVHNLHGIERNILRKRFREPRIHMALVCAARGCPPLASIPYRGATLDRQLQRRTREFLALPSNFQLDAKARVARLSKIFEWFGRDFGMTHDRRGPFGARPATERAVLNFVHAHLPPSTAARLQQANPRIQYLPYDWALNDASRPSRTRQPSVTR